MKMVATLSICIPVYNFDVTALVASLGRQCRELLGVCEIICIDDGSQSSVVKRNRIVCEAAGRYIALEKNVGRASIRNLFASLVQSDYLLFLDCDSVLLSERFVARYLEAIAQGTGPVICGGRVYDPICPGRDRHLRWKYGICKESMPRSVRDRHPHRSFMTNNFAIRRNLFDMIRFDERLRQYGHEDTLFGFKLKQSGIAVSNIENPILNGDVETNREFMRKTDEGVKSLVQVIDYAGRAPELIEDIALARFYEKCRRMHAISLMDFTFSIVSPALRTFLCTGYAPLVWFDLYKLGRYGKEQRANGLRLKRDTAAGVRMQKTGVVEDRREYT
jgi:glycosyltransferase involved in cell wall biosynthesis